MSRPIPLWSETLAAAALGALVVAIVASFLAGCGGDPFTARLGELAALDVDAGEVLEGGGLRSYTKGTEAAADAGAEAEDLDAHQTAPDRFTLVHDAGADVVEVLEAAAALDAGEVLEASRVDTGPPVDAGDEPAPAPALCCDSPCGGGQVAAITCGNGPPWTCGDPSGPSCSSSRCAIGSLCYWQGASCSGRVAVCP